MELHPASVVNDPLRLGKNYRQVSLNTAVEVDLTGQVCSESVGHRELSGFGGASETHIGAQRSPDGKGIIALHSLTAGGEPKIVFELKPGAKVSISRNDIDTVITEYGVARLKGKSVEERVKAMTAIAHPSFRDRFLEQARKERYIIMGFLNFIPGEGPGSKRLECLAYRAELLRHVFRGGRGLFRGPFFCLPPMLQRA